MPFTAVQISPFVLTAQVLFLNGNLPFKLHQGLELCIIYDITTMSERWVPFVVPYFIHINFTVSYGHSLLTKVTRQH